MTYRLALPILIIFLFPCLIFPWAKQPVKARSTSCEPFRPKNPGIADKTMYLQTVHDELVKKWPENKTINILFHGHSVPAGYFNTPQVNTFDAYPHLFHQALKEKYPNAVVNVIVTALGGEHSVQGAARFESDVLTHNPDIVFIDYALNDTNAGLSPARQAWSEMIEKMLHKNIKILLLTPTPHLEYNPGDPNNPLRLHAQQIRSLSRQYGTGLVDSLQAFDTKLNQGFSQAQFLSNGYNHPNRKGHKIVAEKIMEWFSFPHSPDNQSPDHQ